MVDEAGDRLRERERLIRNGTFKLSAGGPADKRRRGGAAAMPVSALHARPRRAGGLAAGRRRRAAIPWRAPDVDLAFRVSAVLPLLGAALLALVVVVVAAVLFRRRPRSLHPLLPARFDFGRRRDTFRHALRLLEERGATTLVETGSARGGLEATRREGASTVVFATWAGRHAAVLHSVDLDPASVEAARRAVTELGLAERVRFHVGDSVAFLEGFTGEVDFLYLDSWDYDRKDREVQRASQLHHLREYEAIEPRLHDASVVLIDDCRLPGGGKGKLVIERMLARGWRVARRGYQVLLVREVAESGVERGRG